MKVPSQIIKKAKRRKSSRPTWSKEQEELYKELFAKLEGLGFTVRREELKSGHRWKAMSGTCRSLSTKFVFIDSRLSPDDQIAFLQAKLAEAEPEPDFTHPDVAVAA